MKHILRRSVNTLPACCNLALAAIGTLALFAGCDDKRDAVPQVVTPPATSQAAAATRPTTQDLLAAPRQHISLGGDQFHLLIDVPPSWKLEPVGTSTFLNGETPHGEVQMQVVMLGMPVKENSVLAMERRARATATSQQATLEVSPLRQIGGTARVMESREIVHNIPILRENNVVEHGDRVEWTVNAFVPYGSDFHVITLTFAGLTLELYNQDRAFLDKVIGSLHYDAAGGAFLK